MRDLRRWRRSDSLRRRLQPCVPSRVSAPGRSAGDGQVGVSELSAAQNARLVFPAGKGGGRRRLPGGVHGKGVLAPSLPHGKCEEAKNRQAKKRGGKGRSEAGFKGGQSARDQVPDGGVQQHLREPHLSAVPCVGCKSGGSQLDAPIIRTTTPSSRRRLDATCKL